MKGLSASQTPDLVVNLKASHKKVEDTRIEPSFECMVGEDLWLGSWNEQSLDYRLQQRKFDY